MSNESTQTRLPILGTLDEHIKESTSILWAPSSSLNLNKDMITGQNDLIILTDWADSSYLRANLQDLVKLEPSGYNMLAFLDEQNSTDHYKVIKIRCDDAIFYRYMIDHNFKVSDYFFGSCGCRKGGGFGLCCYDYFLNRDLFNAITKVPTEAKLVFIDNYLFRLNNCSIATISDQFPVTITIDQLTDYDLSQSHSQSACWGGIKHYNQYQQFLQGRSNLKPTDSPHECESLRDLWREEQELEQTRRAQKRLKRQERQRQRQEQREQKQRLEQEYRAKQHPMNIASLKAYHSWKDSKIPRQIAEKLSLISETEDNPNLFLYS